MTLKFFVLVGIISIFTANVDGQMQQIMQMMNGIPQMVNGMRESQAKGALGNIVKFVLGQTATPSPEMVNFAVVAGSAPTTQGEKDVYLEMLQRAARRTPALVTKFIKTVKGVPRIDEVKLDNHVMDRIMQYDAATQARKTRQKKEEQQKRKAELDALKRQQDHELRLAGVIGKNMPPGSITIDPFYGDPFMDPFTPEYGTFSDPFHVNPQQATNPQPVVTPKPIAKIEPVANTQPVAKAASPNSAAAEATPGSPKTNFSIADLMKLVLQRRNSTGSSPGSAGTPVTTTTTAAPLPTTDPMMHFMMDPFMF